jgi:hypothetical protein
MTEAGKALFVNCICYIRRFEGKNPLSTYICYERKTALDVVVHFGKQLVMLMPDKNMSEKDEDKLLAYFRENIELMCYQQSHSSNKYFIDEELKSLGSISNRKPETLKTLISLLRDPQKEQLARKLLSRYTDEKHSTPEEWEAWLKESEDRIFFSDVGGFKFFVMPKGYLELPPRIELKNEVPLKLP